MVRTLTLRATSSFERRKSRVWRVSTRHVLRGQSVIVLLDREGRPRVRLDGLGKDATAVVEALSRDISPNGV